LKIYHALKETSILSDSTIVTGFQSLATTIGGSFVQFTKIFFDVNAHPILESLLIMPKILAKRWRSCINLAGIKLESATPLSSATGGS
jgi:hypothetical protein